MPNGKVHASVSVLSAGYIAAGSLYAFTQSVAPAPVLAATIGCMAGVLLSPDLDVDEGNISYYIIRRRVGSLPSFLWGLYWWPYKKLVPHRSAISHAPVISTAIRLLYCFWWLIPIWPPDWDISWLIWFAAGLAISDFNHWFLDVVSGGW